MPKKATLPPLAPGVPGRPKTFRYMEQYGVIVICRNEAHQRRVYEKLARRYQKVKVVRT